MTAETLPNTTKTFKFSFPTCTNEEVLFNLEVPVEIPLDGSPRELVQRVINMFHIPVYLEDELNTKLAEFVLLETQSFHNERDRALLDRLKTNDIDVDGLVKGWEKAFKESVVEYSEARGPPDCEVLAATHQRLAHSAALDGMLRMELQCAKEVAQLVRDRDHDIHDMMARQSAEMDNLVRSLGSTSSEADINALSAQQWTAHGAARARWASARSALCARQRAQHTAWMMAAVADQMGDTHSGSSLPSPSPRPPSPPPAPLSLPPVTRGGRLEESFTIHLGSQLKLTHNIRIAAMDLLDLVTIHPDNPSEWSRRMQTSLSLYSSELSAVVILTDEEPVRARGMTSRVIDAASSSTDHHFADIDTQLQDIDDKLKEPVEIRNKQRFECESNNTTSSSKTSRLRRGLQPGDVLLTKHSNLADVHTVFHLITDDSLRGDITSRHPVILGLRSILRACTANDITSLALPLLLAHQMTEEMTMSWCLRRAELVLKCVKGFALETAGGGGAELKTLTMALPPDTAPQLFNTLAHLTPTIFRLSNPVKAKASPS